MKMADLSEYKILIVDDTESNIDILVDILSDTWNLAVAMDGESALKIVQKDLPALILLDIMMPGIDGYEVCKRLKMNESTRQIPIIFLTAMAKEQDEAKGLALGAVDYVTKPFSPELVKSRVGNQLKLKHQQDHLATLVRERTQEVALTQEVTIDAMAVLAEYRDPETGGHIQRTKNYVRVLAEHLKTHPEYSGFLSHETIDLLYKSTPLHEIGKASCRERV